MSTKVVPAPAVQAKRPVRSDKPAIRNDEQKAVNQDEERAAQDDSEKQVASAANEESSNTSLAGDFTFGAALAEAAASAGSLTTEAEGADEAGFSQFGGDGGSTILLVGAVALVGLGVLVLADGGSGNKNEAPTVSAATQSLAVTEDVAKTFTVTASDPDGDALTYTASGATKGVVSGGANGAFTYTPNANVNGTDSFTVTIKDPSGLSVTQTVNVTIAAVPDAPVAGAPKAVTTAEDTALTGTAGITDADGDAITYTVATNAAHGTVVLGQGGAYTYTPNANYNGTDTFSITGTAVDGNATQVFNVTVTPVNDLPVQGALTTTTISVPKDGSKQFVIDFSDVDGDTLTASSSTPAHGTINPTTNTYTPTAGYVGADSFQVTVSDGNGGNVTYTVAVNVVDGPAVTSVAIDNLAGTLTTSGAGGAFVFTDDVTVRTDAVINNFGSDDKIEVDGLAGVNNYSFTTSSNVNNLGGAAADLIISYNAGGNFTQIVLVDAAINADGGNNFVFSYESAVASLGFDFITIV